MAKITVTSDDGEVYGVISLNDWNLMRRTALVDSALVEDIVDQLPAFELPIREIAERSR
jgi:hypothetical protein